MTELADVGAERALLAAVMTSNEVVRQRAGLEPDDFSEPALGTVFMEMIALTDRREPVNPITMRPILGSIRMPDGQTALEYMTGNTVLGVAPDAAALVGRIKDLAARRTLLDVARDLRLDAGDFSLPTRVVSDAIRERLTRISAAAPADQTIWHADHTDALVNFISSDSQAMHPTGIATFDAFKGGIKPGEVMTIGAETSMGKSAVAHEIALNFALRNEGVLIMSFEMQGPEVVSRMASSLMHRAGHRLPYEDIDQKRIDPAMRQMLLGTLSYYRQLPIRTYDGSMASADLSAIERCIAESRRAFEESGVLLSLILIDHIGLVSMSKNSRGNRYASMTELTGTLAHIARASRTSMIWLSQFNREVGKRDSRWPQLSDLRDSGSVEQDSNSVVLLHRPRRVLEQALETITPTDHAAIADARAELSNNRTLLNMIMPKNRGGKTGNTKTNIDIEFNRVT